MAKQEVPSEHFPHAQKISKQHYDVVIVGAGVAGALIAYELVSAGKSVLMIEAGPDQTDWPARHSYVENFYHASQRTPESAYPDVPAAPKPKTTDLYIRPYQGYLDQIDSDQKEIPADVSNDWFKSTYERRVGGTTWHWLGTCLRLVPNDFKMRSVYDPKEPGFTDWPITYDDLAPWYDKAAIEMGVSGDPTYLFGMSRSGDTYPAEYKKYTPAQYPMPNIPQSYSDGQVTKYVDGMHIDVDGLQGQLIVSPTPQARNSVGGYQGRAQCCGNSSCIPVCPIQAKYDATVTINASLKQFPKLFTLLAQAPSHKVEVDDKGNVSGVTYRKWEEKDNKLLYHDYSVSAEIFVLAANALETPKLLLNSKSKRTPNGVANSSGLVGKYLMDHNTQLSYAIVKEPVYSYRGPLSTSGIESLKDNAARGEMGAFRIELGNDGWEWPADAPYSTVYSMTHGEKNEPGIFGPPLKSKLEHKMIRQIRVAALVEPTPIKEHDVQVSDKLDELGLPRPKVRYGISGDNYSIRGMKAAIKVHDEIFKTMGAKKENIFHHEVEDFSGAGHIMGTYRMGDNPSTSVVDKYQRSHDNKNLFLVGSGVFPTVGASNPTFTIGALSLWASQTIIKQLDNN